MDGKPCCAPTLEKTPQEPPGQVSGVTGEAVNLQSMARIPTGPFRMGAEGPECWSSDGEGPVREFDLDDYMINRCCVTNSEFETFVEETGYQTEAESFGWSIVFMGQIPKAQKKRKSFETVVGMHWWAKVEKADWRKPGGPGTNVRKLGDHPVVHVSWNDAFAYAQWTGKKLPTEAQWEKAARGGLDQKRYPWGDDFTPKGKHQCNIWQGKFPDKNTAEDGHLWTAPVKSFPANGFGLHNASGNVWEWTSDWFHPAWRQTTGDKNPTGPSEGTEKVIKGGSFLCHDSYCNRYRPGARTRNTPDSSTSHTGFRLAYSED